MCEDFYHCRAAQSRHCKTSKAQPSSLLRLFELQRAEGDWGGSLSCVFSFGETTCKKVVTITLHGLPPEDYTFTVMALSFVLVDRAFHRSRFSYYLCLCF